MVKIPKFSVAANCKGFEAISLVVTDLLLYTDPGHRSRVDQLETFLFSYDLTDLEGAADLITKLQTRIRQLLHVERGYVLRHGYLGPSDKLDLLAVSAQVFVLTEELNLVFDAISMAQEKAGDTHEDHESALKLVASSSEISWHMLDDNSGLLAKLEVIGIDYSWLNKRDSSTANKMVIKNMRALHGSPAAVWPEILSTYDQPPNHPMVRVSKLWPHP